MKTAIIVPARLASQRFPRKLLFPIQGKPLILWTAERIRSHAPELPLWFAVAERELADTLEAEGFQSVETDPALPSGTDRIAQANERIGAEAVVNVQADEPLVEASHIRKLAELIESDADLATLAAPIRDPQTLSDPNKVKAVVGANGRALYFSRAPIPFSRDHAGAPGKDWLEGGPCRLHLGMYAYKADFLRKFSALPPGRLESIEKLEQLRALENGFSIAVGDVERPTIGIDAPEDAERLERMLQGGR